MQYDFKASTGYWITYSAHQYQQRVDAELRPFGITFRQFQVLAWLNCEGRLTQSELARRMFIEPPTLSGIMTRMETMHWIQRVSCSSDRRKKYLEIGPAAEPVWGKIVAILNKLRMEAVEGLTAAEVDQLHTLLGRVLQNLDRTPLSPPPTEAATHPS